MGKNVIRLGDVMTPERINVYLRFFGALNDFLDRKQKNRWIDRRLNGHPSVGDTVESLGVPHPEIAKVLVNGKPALLYDAQCIGSKDYLDLAQEIFERDGNINKFKVRQP